MNQALLLAKTFDLCIILARTTSQNGSRSVIGETILVRFEAAVSDGLTQEIQTRDGCEETNQFTSRLKIELNTDEQILCLVQTRLSISFF